MKDHQTQPICRVSKFYHHKTVRSFTYRGVHREPRVSIWIEEEDLIVAVLALQATVEDDFLSGTHRDGVMGDSARSTACSLHELPLGNLIEVAVVFHQRVNARQIQAPH